MPATSALLDAYCYCGKMGGSTIVEEITARSQVGRGAGRREAILGKGIISCRIKKEKREKRLT